MAKLDLYNELAPPTPDYPYDMELLKLEYVAGAPSHAVLLLRVQPDVWQPKESTNKWFEITFVNPEIFGHGELSELSGYDLKGIDLETTERRCHLDTTMWPVDIKYESYHVKEVKRPAE